MKFKKVKYCSCGVEIEAKNTYCPSCKEKRKEVYKERYRIKYSKKSKVISNSFPPVPKEEVEKCQKLIEKDLSCYAKVDTLISIQNDCKKVKKGLMNIEKIFEKYKKFDKDLLKRYVERVME